MQGLRESRDQGDRPADLGRLEISVTPNAPLDGDDIKRYEDLGVDRLIPMLRGRTADALEANVEAIAQIAF